MSNNSHILAIRTSEMLSTPFDPETIFDSPGIEWVGETFETGYAFREQLDTIIGPFLAPEVIALLDEGAPEVSGPGWDLLNLVEGVQLTGFTAERFAEFRAGVGRAIAEGDWGHYDAYEWERFVADPTAGDFYVVMEFI